MSRLYEALKQSEHERIGQGSFPGESAPMAADLLRAVETESLGLEEIRILQPVMRPESRLVTLTDEHSLGAEKFRLLGARLRHLQAQRGIKKVLVTSSVVEEGKSLVAANLALTLAQAKLRTLLVEGDLRQPSLSQLFGLGKLRGISEWGQAEESVARYLYRLNGVPLWFLPAGAVPGQPLKILQSPRLSELITQLSSWFDWIVVDSTPLLPLADVNVWARLTDGMLLVIREGRTPGKLLRKALESLDNPKLIGVVFNEATASQHRYYGRYYTDVRSEVKASARSPNPHRP